MTKTKYTKTQLKKMPTASDLTHLNTFMVIAPCDGHWGKGSSLKEAKENCLKQGKCKQLIAYFTTDDVVCAGGCVEATRFLNLGEI